MSNKKMFISGIKWTSFETGILVIVDGLSHLVKAVFLTPYEFAYLAIINIVVQTSQKFEDFGFGKALVQKDEVSNKEITSLLLLNFIVGFILFGFLNFFAPTIENFFDLPGLSNYLHLSSILLLLKAPTTLFKSALERDMKFKQLVKVHMTNRLITFLLLIILLYLGYGIISVVIVNILRALINGTALLIFNYKLTDYRLVGAANIQSIKYYFNFGKFVFGRTIISSIAKHFDELLIGYFFPSDILGYYYFSKNMVDKLEKLIRKSFGKVLFVYFSKLKNNLELYNVYSKITELLAFFSFPIFIGVAVTAKLFMPLIFGEEWLGAVAFVQVFAVITSVLILSTGTAGNLLYSRGKAKLNFQIGTVSDTFYMLGLLIFAQFGVTFILIIRAIKELGFFFFKQLYAMREIERSVLDIFKIVRKPLMSVIVMAAVVLGFQLVIGNLVAIDLITLLLSVLLGAVTYFLSNVNLVKKVYKQMHSLK